MQGDAFFTGEGAMKRVICKQGETREGSATVTGQANQVLDTPWHPPLCQMSLSRNRCTST